MIGYMFTWTTYGSWLQGDKRNWTKDRKIFAPNPVLKNINTSNLKNSPVILSDCEQSKIFDAILGHALGKQHEVFALAVTENHVHLLIENYCEKPGRIVARYKNNAKKSLADKVWTGKPIWTRGSNKKFCNNEKQLRSMIDYIKQHEKLTPYVYIKKLAP